VDNSNPTDMSNITCYGCGKKGHMAKDLKCKNYRKHKPAAKMFTAQEILDEDKEGTAEGNAFDQECGAENHSNDPQYQWDQYDDGIVGSQYSSEGEEHKFYEFEDNHPNNGESTDQMHVL
jgi:hypothetical protein